MIHQPQWQLEHPLFLVQHPLPVVPLDSPQVGFARTLARGVEQLLNLDRVVHLPGFLDQVHLGPVQHPSLILFALG